MIVPVPEAMSDLASGLPAYMHESGVTQPATWQLCKPACLKHLPTMQACMHRSTSAVLPTSKFSYPATASYNTPHLTSLTYVPKLLAIFI